MDQSIIRLTKELNDIQKSSDLSIAIACRDDDLRNVRAVVMGPHETPYEFGFFEFAIRVGRDYPSASPSVLCITTNSGRCRFNPNIYSTGKVCLSILGTWRGEPGEQWSSAQGLESIMLSIQSLLSANPYENEPGFENANSASDRECQKQYVQKIRHETLRISVIQRLEGYLGLSSDRQSPANIADLDDGAVDSEAAVPFEPFTDLCKRRFLWYYQSYLDSVEQGKGDAPKGSSFVEMPFESRGNTMAGKFNYDDLEKRLHTIKSRLDAETRKWAEEGLAGQVAESTVAVNLQHQFDQVVSSFKLSGLPHDISLENGNPFVWIITYIGRPMTNLDGGLLRIKMHLSPRFPEEQPRVRVESKIFHHCVAPDGTFCYTPNLMRMEDIKTHIEAIISCLEEDEPAYDPRKIVHPEASKLYWGRAPTDKKTYSRRLRRSVQDSMDEMEG